MDRTSALPHDANDIVVNGGIQASDPTKVAPLEINDDGELLVTVGSITPGAGLATEAKQDDIIDNTATPAAVKNGQKTVTAAGTAEAISASVAVKGVVVQALADNTGNVYVGDSSVDNTNGHELQPGQATGIAIDNLSKVYVDADTNGDGVCFVGS